MLTDGLDKTLQEQANQANVKAPEEANGKKEEEKQQEEGKTAEDGKTEEVKPEEGKKKPKEVDPTFGFFGNAVKVKEMKNRLYELKVVEEVVGKKDDIEKFRLGGGMLPRPPIWARKCAWSPKDDAMVLVGIFKHGFGSWDKLLADESLDIAEKLTTSVDPNKKKESREGHLQFRACALLRKLREFSLTGPAKRKGGPAAKKKPSQKALTVSEMMGDIKSTLYKIKNLQDETKSYEKEVKVRKMKLYLSRVGSFIEGIITKRGFGKNEEEKLWQYAAKKSHLQGGIKMKAIFQRLKTK